MRVLFAIVSCHKNAARRQAIRDTWLPTLKEDYKFFLGNGDTGYKEDEIQLDVPDKYEALPEKVRAICKWALDRSYDYICKVDDDVYIIPDRLLNSDYDKHPYTGRLNKWRAPAHPKSFLSGFTYWLSSDAAKRVADAALDPLITFEDRWVGGVLSKANIEGQNDSIYKVLSTLPKFQWHAIVKQNFGALCQFEPDDMRYLHGVIIGTIATPLPVTRAQRNTASERYNPRYYRIKRRR